MPDLQHLGAALRALRKRSDRRLPSHPGSLRQEDLGQLVFNVSGQQAKNRISPYERGRTPPDLATLDRLLDAMGFDWVDLGMELRKQAGRVAGPAPSGAASVADQAERAVEALVDRVSTRAAHEAVRLYTDALAKGLKESAG